MRGPRITDRRWRRFRLGILLRDGWRCRYRYPGCTMLATSVDHLTPRHRAPQRMYDEANCFSVCHACHREKERRERAGEEIGVLSEQNSRETRQLSAHTHGRTGRDRRNLLLAADSSRRSSEAG